MGLYIPGADQPAIKEEAPVSYPLIDPSEGGSPNLPAEVLDLRARKYQFGAGLDAPLEDIKNKLNSIGGEQQLREQVASTEAQVQMNVRRAMVEDLIKSGNPLSKDTIDGILGIAQSQPYVDPITVLEKQYAEKVATGIAAGHPSLDNPASAETAHQYIDWASNGIAIQEIARKTKEDLEAQYNLSSSLTHGWDWTKQSVFPWIFPGTEWANLYDPKASGLALGSNLYSQVDDIWNSASPELAKAKIDQRLLEINQRAMSSPLDQIEFLSAVMRGPSEEARTTGNINTALDFAAAPGVGGAAKLGFSLIKRGAKAAIAEVAGNAAIKAAKETAKAAKDATKAENLGAKLKNVVEENGKPNPQAADILSAGGKVEESAAVRAQTHLENISDPAQDIQISNMKMLSDYLPIMFNPAKIMENAGRLGLENSRRIFVSLDHAGELAVRAITSKYGVERVTPEAQAVAETEARQFLNREYDTANSAVLESTPVYAEDNPLTNTGYVVAKIGKANLEKFPNEEQARTFATDYLGLKDQFTVHQDPDGWFVAVRKDFDEKSGGVRTANITTDNTSKLTTGGSLLKRFWMGSKEQMGEFQNQQRATALRASKALETHFIELGKAASREVLSRKQIKNLDTVLERNRDFPHQIYKERRGYYVNTIADLEKEYQSVHGYLPTDREVHAYFAVRQLNEMDYLLRNFGYYQDMSTSGYSSWRVPRRAPEPMTVEVDEGAGFMHSGDIPFKGEANQNTYRNPTFTFDGKEVDSIPFKDVDAGNIVVHEGGSIREYQTALMSEKNIAEIQALKKDGYRFIKVHDMANKEVADGLQTTGPVSFIIVKDAKYQPLSWMRIPYREGGHVKYKSDWYVKQSDVIHGLKGQRYYNGDRAIMNAETQSKAIKISQAFEQARQHYLNKDWAALDNHVKNNLPLEWSGDTLKTKFDNKTLNPDTPFAVTFKGENLGRRGINGQKLKDLFPDLKDTHNSVHNDKTRMDSTYMGERDFNLDSMKNVGTESHPVYHLQTPQLVSPLKVTQEALRDLIKNRFYRDYQIGAAESFVQEFGRGSPDGRVQPVLLDAHGQTISDFADPVAILQNSRIEGGADNLRAMAARRIRSNIISLLGESSEFQKTIDTFKTKMKDIAYNQLGEKNSNFITNSELKWMKDPFQWMKNIAFHTKMGFWNPVQILVQGQTLANIVLISPRAGGRAWLPSIQMRRLALTSSDNIVEEVAKLSHHPNLGMTTDQFKEAFYAMREAGYDKVGGEYSWRGDFFEDNLFKTKATNLLTLSDSMFTGTERFVRINAWNAAYLEHIEKTGLEGRLRRADWQKITVRADDLSANMTKDADAFWQRGLGGNLTQFFGYSARISDLMLGTSLTNAEKLRLFTGYSLLYGWPAALSGYVPMGAIPIYQMLRTDAIAKGDPLNDHSWKSLIYNGLPATAISTLTGVTPNIGGRYGPTGLTAWNDFFTGELIRPEKGVLRNTLAVTLGASGAITGDIIASVNPVMGDIVDLVNGKGNYKILAGDLIQASKEISTSNQAQKVWTALNSAQWVSKNNTILDDQVSPTAAIVYGITGLQPQKVDDSFLAGDIMRSEVINKTEKSKRMGQLYKGYIKAVNDGDEDAKNIYGSQITATMIAGGIDPISAQQMLLKTYDEDTFVRRTMEKFLTSGTTDAQERRLKAMYQLEQVGE